MNANEIKTVNDRILNPVPATPDPSAGASVLEKDTVLYRETVDLGLDMIAAIQVSYDGPAEAAHDGQEWDIALDYPAAKMTIAILHPYWPVLAASGLSLLNERLAHSWGDGSMLEGDRGRTVRMSLPTLSAAQDALLARAAKELGATRSYLARRAARLAKRAKTLADGIDLVAVA